MRRSRPKPAGLEARAHVHPRGTGTLFYVARLRYASNELYRKDSTADQDSSAGTKPSARTVPAAPPALSFKPAISSRSRFVHFDERATLFCGDRSVAAGFEPVESWFATTAASLKGEQQQLEKQGDWRSWWTERRLRYIERHDDRIQLFATRLDEGRHEFSTSSGPTRLVISGQRPRTQKKCTSPKCSDRTETAIIEVQR